MSELIGLFIGGLGGVMLFKGVKTFHATTRRDAYEPATAQVLDSRLETNVRGQGQYWRRFIDWGLETDPNRKGKRTIYVPKVRYEYTVGDETYTNDSLYPGPVRSGSSSKEKPREILQQYPEGKTVDVYYDPSDPTLSFLENRSRNRQAVTTTVVGSGILLFGLALIFGIPL